MNKKLNYKACVFWIAVIACMIVIFLFSSQNASGSTNTSSGFAEFLAKVFNSDYELLSHSKQEDILNKCQFIVRKAAHFTIYSSLGILTLFASYFSYIKHFFITSAAICLAYAVSDEIHQYFVPGRSCALRDVCIDFSGAIFGIIISIILIKMIKKCKT